MRNKFPIFQRFQVEKIFKDLDSKEKKFIENYLLRHSRGTELYQLSREGKISRDTAKDFMGHSKSLKIFST